MPVGGAFAIRTIIVIIMITLIIDFVCLEYDFFVTDIHFIIIIEYCGYAIMYNIKNHIYIHIYFYFISIHLIANNYIFAHFVVRISL